MSILPALPSILSGGARAALGPVAAGAVRGGAMVVSGARRATQSAIAYCRRHPGWCQTVGGVAAIEAMIQRGELPPLRRRRGRGITARELRAFKRVARFTAQYCAPVRRAMKAPAMRRRKC